MKIPAIEPLYAESDVSPSSAIDDVSGQYDHFSERKNRILDILLALYGEKSNNRNYFALTITGSQMRRTGSSKSRPVI